MRDQGLVGEPGHHQAARPRPARRPVDEIADLGAGQDDPAALLRLAEEAQLGGLDAAQRQLLLGLHDEPRLAEVDRVAEPPVVEPHPALAFERLHARTALGSDGDAVRRGGADAEGRRAGQPRRRHVEGPLDGELRGVERAPPERVVEPGAAEAQRDADLRAAQAQLAVRLHHLGLEVLGDGQPVRGDGPVVPVLVHRELVEQQVGAYVRVGEADAVLYRAARQMQIALRGQPRRLQPGDRAADQAQRGEPRLGQQDLLLEPAVLHLDVRDDRPAGEVQHPADLRADQLQRGDPAGLRGRPVEHQQRDDPRPHRALGAPGVRARRVVLLGVGGAQVVRAAVAERLPHAPFGRGEFKTGGRLAGRLGHGHTPSEIAVRLYGTPFPLCDRLNACGHRERGVDISVSDAGRRYQ